eukprot:gnl/Dysnectes_brevis/794_a875_3686.p1 GENE.gnl/Dysnectes_brevis/794_a875_3686~~gnl/Dysnectes_brevis/794_a875_3686.p1  ORF type:complete len:222 (-),score=40.32 gnl/Dysnectes_brevis/794_a875_3686:73-738(-)
MKTSTILYVVLVALVTICSASPMPQIMNQYHSSDHIKAMKHHKPITVTNDIGCTICEIVIQIADDVIETDWTEGEIESFLEKICVYVPDSLTYECELMIESYLPDLVDLLVQQLDPLSICSLLTLCDGSTSIAVDTKLRSDVEDGECSLCDGIVGIIEDLLDSETAIDDILVLLEDICSWSIFGSLEAECDAMADSYLPAIIDALVLEYPADVVCSLLGFC